MMIMTRKDITIIVRTTATSMGTMPIMTTKMIRIIAITMVIMITVTVTTIIAISAG